MPTPDTLREGIERTIPGVDFIDTDDDTITFTVMWGGVDEEGYRTTYDGIEEFTRKYDVGVDTVSNGPDATTWRVVPDGDPFTYDIANDIYFP